MNSSLEIKTKLKAAMESAPAPNQPAQVEQRHQDQSAIGNIPALCYTSPFSFRRGR